MATADEPQASTATPTPEATAPALTEGTTPTAADGAILPAPPPGDTPAVPAASPTPTAADILLLERLDSILVAAVLLFAFVLALFPAKNSDFLQQLAVGRLIAQGQYHFGADPFTLAGDATGWVNHSWLFGLGAYLVYQLGDIGASALVVLKALLVAGTAGLMFLVSIRPGQRRYLPAVITALAVLALSPRLLLQPVVVSYFFLALTLWLVDRPRRLREQGGPADATPTSWWLLPILFAVWVNVDQWFFLGPLTVALYLGGELMQKDKAPRLGVLGVVLAASVVACLLNPYHVHAFTLPAQLSFSSGMEELKDENSFRTLGMTPLQSMYFNSTSGLNTAGMAFFPLALVGVVSFGLTWGVSPWWRFTVWLGFLLLSLIHARAIAFFAVVAGPITALNFLEYMAMQAAEPEEPTWQRYRLEMSARVAALVFGVGFLGAGALGMLQAYPEERRLGTGIVVDPLLQQAAEEIGRRQQTGDPAGTMVCFNTTPEIAHYLSWFGPGVRGFMDARLPQFPDAARAYATAKKALTTEQQPVVPGLGFAIEPAYRAIFRDKGVRYLLLSEPDPLRQSALRLLQQVLLKPEEWSLLSMPGGRVLLLAWHDASTTGRAAVTTNLSGELHKAAFGPEVEPLRPNPVGEAPPAANWWSWLLEAKPARSPHEVAAANYLALFEAYMPAYQSRTTLEWQAFCQASLVAGAGVDVGGLANGAIARWPLVYLTLGRAYVGNKDDGPPAVLYLGLRAARRALAENPGEARTHMLLGEIYYSLGRHTRERFLASPYLANLRQCQSLACFQQALALDPEQPLAQLRLGDMLGHDTSGRPMFLDSQVKFYSMRADQLASSNSKADQDQAKALEANLHLEQLRAELKSRQDTYLLESANRHPLEQVKIALGYGLAEKAIELLQKFIAEEQEKGTMNEALALAVNTYARLLFATGRVAEARDLLSAPVRNALGNLEELQVPAYTWYMLVLAAIAGDADEVDNHAAELLARTADPGRYTPQIAVGLGQYLLSEALLAAEMPGNGYRLRLASLPPPVLRDQIIRQSRFLIEMEAKQRVLHAVTLLEAGELKRAREELDRALVLSSGPAATKGQPRVPLSRATRDLSQMYLDWLNSK